jgi:hypothetical protein
MLCAAWLLLQAMAVRGGPPQREAKIMKHLESSGLATVKADSHLAAFGVQLQQPAQMTVVNARVLPGPLLQYGSGRHVEAGGAGDWNIAARDMCAASPVYCLLIHVYSHLMKHKASEMLRMPGLHRPLPAVPWPSSPPDAAAASATGGCCAPSHCRAARWLCFRLDPTGWQWSSRRPHWPGRSRN